MMKIIKVLQNLSLVQIFLGASATLLLVISICLLAKVLRKEPEPEPSNFNTEMPEANQTDMASDKQTAYKIQDLGDKYESRQEIKEYAEDMKEEHEELKQATTTSSRSSYNSSAKEKVIASNDAMKNMNKAAVSFYDKPKSAASDTEKQKLQSELDELKSRLSQQQSTQSMSVEEQMAVVERSYQLAAKYMPGTQSQQVAAEQSPPKESYSSGKVAVNNIGTIEQSVVSSLSTSGSGSFNTAVGIDHSMVKNTIAACVHSDQTIIDAGAIRLRLLEPMLLGDKLIPKNAIIVGYSRVSGQRLAVSISSIEYQGFIMPVELVVIDSDGQQGIFIPNSMELDALKEVVSNLSTSTTTSVDLSEQDALSELVTDLGEGVIDGVSGYVGKKLKQQKVHLKAGYKLMLYQKKM